MSDINADIKIGIDTSEATAAIKELQRQISLFHQQMAQSGTAANQAAARQMQNTLMQNINATGQFRTQLKTVQSESEHFQTQLEKNQLSVGQYFRYAGAASKSFGKLFKEEFKTIEKTAIDRVKTIQTQYIKLGRDANGALKAIAVKPLALDMENLGTKLQISAQKQQLLNQLLKQGSTAMLNWGKNTQWAGRQLMVGFTVPLMMAGTAAAKAYIDIEKAAVKFKRVYGDFNTSSAETNKMAESIKLLASEYTKYGIAVADTMNMAADAAAMGKTGVDLMQQVQQATKLAVLGGVDQAKALETATSLTNAFGIASEDLGKKVDYLNAVENQTVLSIEDMTVAIPKAAPVVKQLGGNVEDLTYFLTAMKEGGINASEGANALKSGLASMINPTKQASNMLAGYGINLKGIVDANKGNIAGAVRSFAVELDKLAPLDRARAIEQLFGKFQFARMSTMFKNITNDGSQANRVMDLAKMNTEELAVLSEREMKKIESSPAFKFQKAIADIQTKLAPVGEAFLKAITPVVEWVGKILDGFNKMSDGAKQFTTMFTLVVAGIGPAALMTLGLVANGVANLIKMFSNVKSFFNRRFSGTSVLGQSTEYLTQKELEAQAVSASLHDSHAKLTQQFTAEASAVSQLVEQYEKAISAQQRLGGGPGTPPAGPIPPTGGGGGGPRIPTGPTPPTGSTSINFSSGGPSYQAPIPGVPAPVVNNGLPKFSDSNLGQALISAIPGGNTIANIAGKTAGMAKKAAGYVADKFRSKDVDAQIKQDASDDWNTYFDTWKAKSADGQGDPYVQNRDRNSPHRLVAVDAKDDATEYSTEFAQSVQASDITPENVSMSNKKVEKANTLSALLKIDTTSAPLAKIPKQTKSFWSPEFFANFAEEDAAANAATERALDIKGVPESERGAIRKQQSYRDASHIRPDSTEVDAGNGMVARIKNWIAGNIKPDTSDINRFGSTVSRGSIIPTDNNGNITKEYLETVMKMTGLDSASVERELALLKGGNHPVSRESYQVLQAVAQDRAQKDPTDWMAASVSARLGVRLKDSGPGSYLESQDRFKYDFSDQEAAEKSRDQTLKAFARATNKGIIERPAFDMVKENLGIGQQGGLSFVKPKTSPTKDGQDDGKEYLKARDETIAAGRDPYEPGRHRNSPFWQSSKDGKDDGDSYIDSRDNAIAAGGDPYQANPVNNWDNIPGVPKNSNIPGAPGVGPTDWNTAPAKKPGFMTSIFGGKKKELVESGKSIGSGILSTIKDKAKNVGESMGLAFAKYISNGDVTLTDNEGNVRYDAETGTTYGANGQVISRRSKKDKGVQTQNEDGSVTTTYRDGSSDTEYADGTKTSAGAIMTQAAPGSVLSYKEIKQDWANRGLKGKEKRAEFKKFSKEQKKEYTRGAAARVAGGAAIASTVVGMAAASGNETAQQVMPLVSGFAGLTMLIQGPMSAAIVGVVAIIGALIYAFMQYNAAINKGIDQSLELSDSLGTGSTAMKNFAAFSGKVTASEVMDKRRASANSIYGIAPGKTTVGENFVESDTGKAMIKAMKTNQANSGGGSAMNASDMKAQLSTAVLSGALSAKEARSIAVEMGKKMGNTAIGIKVAGDLVDLFGPNGENVLDKGLEIRTKLVQQSRANLNKNVNESNKRLGFTGKEVGDTALGATAGAAVGAAGGAAIGSVIFPGVGTAIGAVVGAIGGAVAGGIMGAQKHAERLGRMAGATVALTKSALEQEKQLLDSLDMDYQKRIDAAKAAGDTAKAEKLQNEYIVARQKLLDENRKTSKEIDKNFEKSQYKDQLVSGSKTAAEKAYKGTAEEDLAKVATDAIQGVGDQRQQYRLNLALSSKDMNPTQILDMLNLMGTDYENVQKVLDISANLGGPAAGEVSNIISMFADENGKPLKSAQKDFVTRMSTITDGKQSRDLLDLYSEVGKSGNAIDIPMFLDILQKDPIKEAQLLGQINEIKKLDGKKLTYEIVRKDKILDPKTKDLVKQDMDYFNHIKTGEQKKIFLEILSEYSIISDTQIETSNDFKAWQKSEGAQYKDLPIAEQIAKYKLWNAERLSTTRTDSIFAGSGKKKGGGGGPTKHWTDDVVKSMRDFVSVNQKLTTGINASVKALKNFKKAADAAFNGLSNQLRTAGASEGMIQKILEDDAKNVGRFFKNGKLTADGLKVQARIYQESIGKAIDAQRSAVATTQAQTVAMTKLTSAGVSYTLAMEMLENTELAQAIAASKNKAQIDALIKSYEDAKIAAYQYNAATEEGRAKNSVDIAESQIAALEASSEVYQNGLDRIAMQEQDINKAYDERVKALDKVYEINRSIADSQKDQLSLVDALSKGDIFAAAKAMAEQRSRQAQKQQEDQKKALSDSRDAQIKGIQVMVNGQLMSREKLENSIKKINGDILNIKAAEIVKQNELIKRKEYEYKLDIKKKAESGYKPNTKSGSGGSTSTSSSGNGGQSSSGPKPTTDAGYGKTWQKVGGKWQAVDVKNNLVGTSSGMIGTGKNVREADYNTHTQTTVWDDKNDKWKVVDIAKKPTGYVPQGYKYVYDNKTNSWNLKPILGSVNNPRKITKAGSYEWNPGTYVKVAPGLRLWTNSIMGSSKNHGVRVSLYPKNSQSGNYVTKGNTVMIPYTKDDVDHAWVNPIKNRLSDGGYSTGPGTGTSDSIPTLLSNGEFVIRAAAAQVLGPTLLNMLNHADSFGFNMPKADDLSFNAPKIKKFGDSRGSSSMSRTEKPAQASSANNFNPVYNINVDVNSSNASPDEIAMAVMKHINRGNNSVLAGFGG